MPYKITTFIFRTSIALTALRILGGSPLKRFAFYEWNGDEYLPVVGVGVMDILWSYYSQKRRYRVAHSCPARYRWALEYDGQGHI
jgi:hypothetical protein